TFHRPRSHLPNICVLAEITQQYSRVNTRFEITDEDLDHDNTSARLFERSRIKALAGTTFFVFNLEPSIHWDTIRW
uniref:Uncharacterized protein n=1 Tax=Gadus morhua TaxID=8049 RepID=A0A8C5CAM3_GADMO